MQRASIRERMRFVQPWGLMVALRELTPGAYLRTTWKVKFLTLLLALAAFAVAEPPPGYELKWADEFDGTQLDATKWKVWLNGVRRDAINTPDAVSVADGTLTIPTLTESGKHYKGMVTTQGSVATPFGYFERRTQGTAGPPP